MRQSHRRLLYPKTALATGDFMSNRDSINLVVCCDGTGNVWKPGPGKTNVVKLVESLAREPLRQLHFYDPGVGTPDGYISESGQALRDVVRRVSGLVWGDGVWANVAAAYAFLVRNYQIDDRIYLFGFSRGAFTARAVAGLISLFGVLRSEHENLIPTLLQIYRTKPQARASNPNGQSRSEIGESIRANFCHLEQTPVHFIGVWDTVESVGLSQLALGTQITSVPTVKPAYRHVRHALALDELRWPYQPRLYTEPDDLLPEQTFKQVWFAGAHSDVGGGYAEQGLANAALHWMAREASFHELLIEIPLLQEHAVNALDTLHDEVASLPFWVSVGAFRRNYPERIRIHESVAQRMANGAASYQPALPAAIAVEATRSAYIDLQGNEISASVPTASELGQPVRMGIKVWHVVLWAALSALTIWIFSIHSQDALQLARTQSQGWVGALCDDLAQWSRISSQSVGHLLRIDTLAIVFYSAWLSLTSFFLLRLAARNGTASPQLGKLVMYSAGFLPLADLFENTFTAVTLLFVPEHVTTCTGGHLLSYLTAMASTAKFMSLGMFGLAALSCAACALTSRMRRA